MVQILPFFFPRVLFSDANLFESVTVPMATQGSVETVQGLMEGEAAEADFTDRMEGLL